MSARADELNVIWPAAALAVLLLGFVVVYGSALQARLEGASRAPADTKTDTDPGR